MKCNTINFILGVIFLSIIIVIILIHTYQLGYYEGKFNDVCKDTDLLERYIDSDNLLSLTKYKNTGNLIINMNATNCFRISSSLDKRAFFKCEKDLDLKE